MRCSRAHARLAVDLRWFGGRRRAGCLIERKGPPFGGGERQRLAEHYELELAVDLVPSGRRRPIALMRTSSRPVWGRSCALAKAAVSRATAAATTSVFTLRMINARGRAGPWRSDRGCPRRNGSARSGPEPLLVRIGHRHQQDDGVALRGNRASEGEPPEGIDGRRPPTARMARPVACCRSRRAVDEHALQRRQRLRLPRRRAHRRRRGVRKIGILHGNRCDLRDRGDSLAAQQPRTAAARTAGGRIGRGSQTVFGRRRASASSAFQAARLPVAASRWSSTQVPPVR